MIEFIHRNIQQRDEALEAEAAEFVANYTRDSKPLIYESTVAAWNYNTNLTDENLKLQVNISNCLYFNIRRVV